VEFRLLGPLDVRSDDGPIPLGRQDADQPPLFAEEERSRAAVHLDGAQRHARMARDPADP
jgi:hypothetical protein